jgi:hypothetical protein
MKNFHLPLPEQTYAQLRGEAERMQVSATAVAREAVEWWLRERLRNARQDKIAAYAAEVAGTSFDLDSDLESAVIEQIVRPASATK